MGYRIRSLPEGVGPAEAFDALIACVLDGGQRLPPGYRVSWQWRNAPHLPLHSQSFSRVVRESARGGFREIMIERLEADRQVAIDAVERLEKK